MPHQASKKLVDDPSMQGPRGKGDAGGAGLEEQQGSILAAHCEERGRAKSLLSCPTLCDPMDHSPPGSSVHRIRTERSRSTQPVTATKEGRVGRNGEDASPKLAEWCPGRPLSCPGLSSPINKRGEGIKVYF